MKSSFLKYTVLMLVLSACIQVIAQENPVSHVSGIVTDTLFKPIQYATVQLFSLQNSTLSYGAATAEDGNFLIKNVPQGTYKLKVSSIGYEIKTKTVRIQSKNTSLGLITLKSTAYLLDGVEIKATRTGLSERFDKTIFIPDSASLRTAKTGIDILNKIPEIKVDKKDYAVSVLGNKNVLVLINGVDNNRSIASIHPQDIERVELITHPSVKYQSDVASVINIVLKGYKQKGFSLSSNIYAGLDKKNHLGNIQLNYGIGKWHFFASFIGSYKYTKSIDYIRRTDSDETFTDHYLSSPVSNNTSDAAFNRFQYGLDYNIDQNNLLSFTSRIVSFNIKSFRHNKVTVSTNDLQTAQSKIATTFHSDKIDQNYSIYYLHRFKKEKEKLEINTNYFFLNNDSRHVIRDTTVLYPGLDEGNSSREITGESKQHSFNTRIDYYTPLTRHTDLEAGYQLYGRKIKNRMKSTENENSLVSYSDYRNSLYVNASYARQKWNFQAGARLENFNIKVSEVKNNQTKFLPYVTLFYKPNTNSSLKFTYRKSLKYPVYSSLNPFKYYSSDSLSYFAGNPYLEPEQKNNFNLKYSYKKRSSYLSLSLNYDYLDHLIAQEVALENNILAYRYKNAGKAHRYEGVLSFSTVLFDLIEVELLLRGSYTDYLTNKTHSGYAYAAECGVVTPLFWGIDLEVSGVLKEREINYTGYYEYGGNIEEILLTKNITKNLFAGFAVRQPFFHPKDTDKTWGDHFTEINRYKELGATSYLLNLTYYFKSGKNIKKIKKNLQMEDIQEKGKQAR